MRVGGSYRVRVRELRVRELYLIVPVEIQTFRDLVKLMTQRELICPRSLRVRVRVRG